jgi:RES domain-containing protein
MRLWRLTRPAFARALDGEGNRESGSRWNSPGHGIVYASRTLALCVLETFVHFPVDERYDLPPMTATMIDCPDLPGLMLDRTEFDAMSSDAVLMRRKGDEWLKKGEFLWFEAPSVIVPQDTNVMLNPSHPVMINVSIMKEEEFQFDKRLIGL